MKRTAIVIIAIAALFMSGCLISSLHPFYKSEDKVFDSKLLGHWIDSDSSYWVIEKNYTSGGLFGENDRRPDSTYRMRFYENDTACSTLKGTLFELDGRRYVDFYPHPDTDHFSTDMTNFHHTSVHTLARIFFKKDTILLSWYGEEWLHDLFEQNRVRIGHETLQTETHKRHILTAQTDDLQKFIRKYMSDFQSAEEFEAEINRQDDDGRYVFVKLFPYDGPVPK